MSLEVIRRPSPSEDELVAKREELVRQKAQLVEQEFILASFKAELAAFNGRYLRCVGVLYAELDEWHARIAECTADQAGTPEAHALAAEARTLAEASYSEAHCEANRARPFTPSEEVKWLYREAVRCVHPDIATDAPDRIRRERLLAEVNGAFSACDETALKGILAICSSNPEVAPHYGAGADLIRVQLQLSQVRSRTTAIKQELAYLRASEIARLKQDAESAQSESRDLLEEMGVTVRNQIERTKKNFEDLAHKVRPDKSSLIMRGRRDAVGLAARASSPEAILTSQSLCGLIDRTIFVIDGDENRCRGGYALLHLKQDSVVMVATDGSRYSIAERTSEVIEYKGGEKRLLIPCTILRELKQVSVTGVETVALVEEEESFGLRIGDRIFAWDKPAQQTADYEAAIPSDSECFVVVRAGELSGAIQRAVQSAYNKGRWIRIQLKQNELRICSADTCFGEGEETLNVDYSGKEVSIGFDSIYLLEFLSALDNEIEVRFELRDTNSACQMRVEGNDNGYQWRYVVMPARVNLDYGELPTEFSISIPTDTLRNLIDDLDLDDLFGPNKSWALQFRPDALAVVSRDGYRLLVAEVTTNQLTGINEATRIMVPRDVMRALQLLLSGFDGETVELAQSKDGFRFRIGLRYLGWLKYTESSPDRLVELPPTADSIALSANVVNKLIEGTAFAIGERWDAQFALLLLQPNLVSLVTTDGYRLSSMEKTNERIVGIFDQQSIVIPRDILLELGRILKTANIKELELAESAEACSFRLGDIALNWAKPTNKFPNYEEVTERRRTKYLYVEASDLRAAIRRLHQQCGWREMPLLLKLRNGELGVSWDNPAANGDEEIVPACYSGGALTAGFQANLILEFLNVVADQVKVRIEFEDAQSSWELSPAGLPADYRWRYFVTPRRLCKINNRTNSEE
jgi:DNA polymerase III sliding clamp (beta) subunit (PCNA family)